MKDWFKLYITRNQAEANMIQGMLQENDIPAVIMNKQDSSYLVFGEIEIYVQHHFKDIAKELLDAALMN